MLSTLVCLPLVGAALIGLYPSAIQAERAKAIALTLSGLVMVWTVYLMVGFDPTQATLQFEESLPWIATLGLSYRLGIDGLSLPLLAMNSLLVWIAIYSSPVAINRPRLYYSLVLVLGSAVAGAFMAQNTLLFFLFYELELIPLYLLIAIWGGAKRGYAATKFLIYTAISGILILAAFFGLTLLSGLSTFDLAVLRTQTLPLSSQVILLLTLVVGFGIKIPLVPLHTWLPDAHVEASTPTSVLLAGVLLKLGTYGLLRFGLQLFPEAWSVLAPGMALVAVINVLYGSFVAIAETDMKKIVAYSSVGHMGYVILSMAAATPLALLGSVAQMVSHGLISALLFLLVGVVYTKAGTRDVNLLRGLLTPERGMPVVGTLMILGVMASAGIPGMVGFIAEFVVYRSSFAVFPVQTLLCMVGTGLTAVYFLNLVNRAFFGRLPDHLANLPRVYWRDRIPSIIVALLVIVLGLQPGWIMRWTEATTTAIGQESAARVAQLHAQSLNPLSAAIAPSLEHGS